MFGLSYFLHYLAFFRLLGFVTPPEILAPFGFLIFILLFIRVTYIVYDWFEFASKRFNMLVKFACVSGEGWCLPTRFMCCLI